MSNELAVAYKANDGSDIQLDPSSIAKYIVAGQSGAQASEKDIARFIAVCQARKLNPLAGDSYLTVYKNKDGSTQASIIVSKDYFQDVANNSKDYDGCKGGVITYEPRSKQLVYHSGSFFPEGEQLVGGWAEVYVKGRAVPEREEVSLREYSSGRSLWASKAGTMIAKVARVHALRAAFPRAFGGVYDASEIDTEPAPQPVQATVQAPPAPKPTPKPVQAPAVQMTKEQADELAALCGNAADAMGQESGEVKRWLWQSCRYDGGDWSAYISRARMAIGEHVSDVLEQYSMAEAQDEAEAATYEC